MSSRILQGPNFRFTLQDESIGRFLFNNAEKYKDRICHIDAGTDKTETYGSVKLRSTRVAIAMQKKGITSDDIITCCSPNTLDNTVPIIAAYFLGAKVSNLEASMSVRHAKYLVSLVNPKMIFVHESALHLIEESIVNSTFDTEIIVFGNSEKYTVFSDLLAPQENEDEFKPAGVDPDDTAVILFSSGTTGMPKIICHSHRSFLYITLQTYEGGARESVAHYTTFYWITASMLLTACFKSGSYRVFLRDGNAEEIFRTIEKHKVSFMFMLPYSTYQLTNFKDAGKYDTSSLKLIFCSGTIMAESQFQKMYDLFPSANTFLISGMSEIGMMSYFDFEIHRKLAKTKLKSSGKVAPGLQLKIVDPETEELLGANKTGEIRVKALSMMKCYYKTDTAQAFDREGYFKTGDIGYYDDDDCLYLLERIKEMFKYQWWHIIPSLVEAALIEHPAIQEAVVFGIPDGVNGEMPAACIVLKENCTLTEEEIDIYLQKVAADRERLRGGVTFLKSLPKTPTGKYLRREAKELFLKTKTNNK